MPPAPGRLGGGGRGVGVGGGVGFGVAVGVWCGDAVGPVVAVGCPHPTRVSATRVTSARRLKTAGGC
ncbi:MAG: hypothetical protein E6J16_03585 [Chloroflexota bacterium]|nr:MAG: hypothetical protein E6J16_03585 [Chloroflexota bacterium]TMD83618.1 MAG: hypothetical protein E6I78_12250 [Chloroflexota bacterium]